ncbi:hypothetical protein ARMGADRAFT_542367 [Armillaria gallica]|uniref:Uncharacterized protein n=1 Tax=Armillaria gallica TaxID=47427 RepID=A0A2H3DF37_ARMGA|nr:hypothetical protein ARMGADRAFT_542367 [Armillaria gallica]
MATNLVLASSCFLGGQDLPTPCDLHCQQERLVCSACAIRKQVHAEIRRHTMSTSIIETVAAIHRCLINIEGDPVYNAMGLQLVNARLLLRIF